MEKVYFFLFLSILYIEKSINASSSIVLPLESFKTILEEGGENDDSEQDSFIYNLFYLNIASTVKIGSKSYPIKTFFNINSAYFYITKKCNVEKTSSFDYKTNFNYNRYQSNSFYNTSSFDITFGSDSNACIARENFKFNNYDKEEITIEKINFILNEDTDDKTLNCLEIGLLENQLSQSVFKGINIITQLKENKYTKEYTWSIIFNKATKYNNDNLLYDPDELLNLKGNIFIGDYPHNFDSENYYKSQLKPTYASYIENIMKWDLKFNKIFYIKNDNKEFLVSDKTAKLDPSNYLIYAPKSYFDSISDNFFQKYIDVKSCYNYYFEEYSSIYCHKTDKFTINDIKSFPSIYFEHADLDFKFELSYKDLFVEKDNIYWFLIVSDNLFYTTDWSFGNIFMRKYQFTFNLDKKEIGFYNPNYRKENNDSSVKGSSNTILYILLIIALVIILIGIGIFIKMKFFSGASKKKRANELDDDYEYVSHKNDKNNNNNNDENENKLFNNNDNDNIN